MAERKYSEQVNIDNALKLRELLKQMPWFAADYFRAIEPTTESRTRIAYAYDMIVFFKFLKENNGKEPKTLCVICGMTNAAYKRPDGVYVVPITALKP